MFRTACLLLLFTAELFFWMNKTDAFTIPCEASLKTVKRVTRCPSDSITYDEAVKAKNCSAVAAEAQACSSFEYHCVLSEDYEYAVEVCAPSFLIIGGVCAMFNRYLKGILRIEGKNCKECPYNYSSTFAYQYAECYANITKYYRTEIQQSSETPPTSIGISEDENMNDEINTPAAVLGSIAAILLVLLLILLVFFLRWKKRKGMPDKYPEEMQMLPTTTDSRSNNITVNGGTGVHCKEPMQSGQEMTSDNDAVNGGPDRFYKHPLPSSQEISSNNEDIYRGEKIHFINFCDDLANQFPREKLPRLKLYLNASGKLNTNASLKAAHSVLEVFNVLLEENVFSRNDVLFLQIMLKRINCDDLYEKCINYASTKRACFFESDSDDGNLKVHVKDDLNDDTEGKIETIIEEISLILKHNKNNIRVIRLVPSTSFFLVLSIAEADTRKLLCLNEENQLKLRRLNIDYLIVDKEIITLERSKGIMNDENENKRDADTVFADFCDDLAMNFPLKKLQKLKALLKVSSKIDLSSLEAADSPFECLALLFESLLLSRFDVVFLQFLLKTLHCEELYSKCWEFASRQHTLCFRESLSDTGFLTVNISGSIDILEASTLQNLRETVADIFECSLEHIQFVNFSVKDKQECVADKSSAMSSGFEPSDEKCSFISKAKPSYLKEMKDPEKTLDDVQTNKKEESKEFSDKKNPKAVRLPVECATDETYVKKQHHRTGSSLVISMMKICVRKLSHLTENQKKKLSMLNIESIQTEDRTEIYRL